MSRVLMTTHGSDFALRAGRRSAALLAPDCEITVLRVVGHHVPGAMGAETVALFPDPAVVKESERAEQREAAGDVDALMAALPKPAEARIERGDPGVVTCKLADEKAFDLIVVGSHGHGLIKRMLIGSVSNHVLRHAPAPCSWYANRNRMMRDGARHAAIPRPGWN